MYDSQSYHLVYIQTVEGQLKKLDRAIAEQIARKLLWLAENAETIRHKALVGNLSGLYRYRIGDYRVLYSLDVPARVLMIVEIGHRREVYKD